MLCGKYTSVDKFSADLVGKANECRALGPIFDALKTVK